MIRFRSLFFLLAMCSALVRPDMSCAKGLEYKDLLVAFVAMTQDSQYPKLVDDWMQVFRPNVWYQFKNDQFSLNARREEMKKFIDTEIAAFDANEQFEIVTNAELGDYDFQDHVLDLHPFSASQTFRVTCPVSNSLPNAFVVSFDNPDILNGIPMDEGKAKAFLESRKSGGYYNKRVVLNVKAVPVRAKQNHAFAMKIVRIDVLDNERSNKIIYSVGQ